MDHAKGQRTCLLCHLSVQPDELVVAAFDGNMRAQQPLFQMYKNLLCQKFPCFLCMTGNGPAVLSIHLDCYLYRQRFFPETKLSLRDILHLWPGVPDIFASSPRQNRIREKESFKLYFGSLVKSRLVACDSPDEIRNLLTLMGKLPEELLMSIAELSWPCALQQPATIMAEVHGVAEFLAGDRCNNVDRLKYMGEHVSITHLTLFGYSYVTGICINQDEVNMDHGCRDHHIRVAITRDDVGILDVNFRGDFNKLQRGCWYKLLGTDTGCMILRVYFKDIVTDIGLARDDTELQWDPYWDLQLPTRPRVPTWYIIEKSINLPTFMRYVGLDNDVQGITVSCDARGILSIHSHTHDRDLQFYKETEDKVPAGIVWVYFPLAKEETVTAGWVRELDNNLNVHHPALVLSTSLRRTRTFGPYIPPQSRNEYRFRSLGSHFTHPVTGLCYNDMGIASSTQFKLGLTYDMQIIHSNVSPEPSFDGMHILPDFEIAQWFKSSASLSGVERIRLCVDSEKSHIPTIGILLVYADREESLGQWRYDRDVEDIVLTGPMYLLSGKTVAGPYVRIAGNRMQEEEGWDEIKSTDWIIWWFTSECTHVEIRKENNE